MVLICILFYCNYLNCENKDILFCKALKRLFQLYSTYEERIFYPNTFMSKSELIMGLVMACAVRSYSYSHSAKLCSSFPDLASFLLLPIVNLVPLPKSQNQVSDTKDLLPRAFVKTSAKLKNVRTQVSRMES